MLALASQNQSLNKTGKTIKIRVVVFFFFLHFFQNYLFVWLRRFAHLLNFLSGYMSFKM